MRAHPPPLPHAPPARNDYSAEVDANSLTHAHLTQLAFELEKIQLRYLCAEKEHRLLVGNAKNIAAIGLDDWD